MTDGPAYDVWIGDLLPVSGIKITIGRHQQDPGAAVIPMGEIHSDLDVIHNTSQFSADASGVIRYDAAETRLELGPSQSGWQPIVTAVYFDAYDSTGGQATSTTAITLNLDTERANSHPEIFVLTSDVLQINMSGVYEFTYRFTADGTARLSHMGFIDREPPGGAATEIDGSRAWAYNRSGTSQDTGYAKFILPDVVVGEKFRVRIVQDVGVALVGTLTLSDAGGLTVRKLA